MYSYVYVLSMEGVGPQNVRPITAFSPNAIIGCPTCLTTYVFSYLCAPARADITQHQRVSCYAELDRRQSQRTEFFIFIYLCVSVATLSTAKQSGGTGQCSLSCLRSLLL